MARKTVEANIAYDDIKQRYYVTLHYGMDTMGNRMKRTRCFPPWSRRGWCGTNLSGPGPSERTSCPPA